MQCELWRVSESRLSLSLSTSLLIDFPSDVTCSCNRADYQWICRASRPYFYYIAFRRCRLNDVLKIDCVRALVVMLLEVEIVREDYGVIAKPFNPHVHRIIC